ncbi:hypothetical protein LTS08_004986 [Lithohypha guttulata]|nr:hypothetical protein LTS08_004986 [Lithohypha guttulata]
MVVETQKRSRVADTTLEGAINAASVDQLKGAQRPDLSHIQTDDLPNSESHRPSNDLDNLHYSASTSNLANPHRLSTAEVAEDLKPILPAAISFSTQATISRVKTYDNMSKFTVLSDGEEEDGLHAKRLLNVEEKSFKRIQKRLLTPTNVIQSYLRRRPVDSSAPAPNASASAEVVSEPEEGDEGEETAIADVPKTEEEINAYLKNLETFTHSTLHDFSSLTTSLARLQFLLASNARERERYATQSEEITHQHTTIRGETAQLRSRLSEARQQLEVRKGWDKHAEKVLWLDGKVGGEKAKTREELTRESDKLRAEIEELEREGEDMQQQWLDRRHALADVIGESRRLRRVVRGEPEQVEDARSERDHEGEDGDQQQRREEDDAHTNMLERPEGHEGGSSNVGTPRPLDEGVSTPAHVPIDSSEAGAGDEVGLADANTPIPEPTITENVPKQEAANTPEDADMADASFVQQEQQGTPRVVVPQVTVDEAEKDEMEEGEDHEMKAS